MTSLQAQAGPAKWTKILRWTARVLSLPAVGIMLLFLFGEWDMSAVGEITPDEWFGLALFPFAVVLGLVLAWRWEALGAGICMGALTAFYLYNFILVGSFPDGPFFLLFGSPAIFFAWSGLLRKRSMVSDP